MIYLFFFFNDTATTEIYTLSLHDALPIWEHERDDTRGDADESLEEQRPPRLVVAAASDGGDDVEDALDERIRSEEHTSELQSQSNLVCRLLLEKKKNINLHISILQRCSLQ